MWMQNQKRTWKVNIRKKNPTVLYLVSSIQCVVSDTCACDQTGQRKKEEGKKTCCIFTQSCHTTSTLWKTRAGFPPEYWQPRGPLNTKHVWMYLHLLSIYERAATAVQFVSPKIHTLRRVITGNPESKKWTGELW